MAIDEWKGFPIWRFPRPNRSRPHSMAMGVGGRRGFWRRIRREGEGMRDLVSSMDLGVARAMVRLFLKRSHKKLVSP